MNWREKIHYFLVLTIITGSFAVRLYKINNPIADWHSWRQADTAAVARNFEKFGFDPFRPRFDDLSNVQSGRENPYGWRMVEFPLYQSLGYGVYKTFSGFPVEQALRLVSIFFSLLSLVFIYKLVSKYSGTTAALAASFFYGFLPYSIYYSRTILPEVTAVSLALGAVFFSDSASEIKAASIKYQVLSIFSAILAAGALLAKPTAGFLLLPIGYLLMREKKFNYYILLSVIPLLLWRYWIKQFPEGIPAYTWLLNGGNIRFTGAFFRWVIAERLAKLILGYTGIFLFFLGILSKSFKNGALFAFLLLGTILYTLVFARGNVQHDYYQILAIPVICIYLGKGVSLLLDNRSFSRITSILVLIVITFSMLAFSWYEVRGYYWINHPEIVEVGKRVDVLVPKETKVIAPYNGDTAFLYQTKRQGWPVIEKPIPEMVKMGAEYLVIVNPDKDALNLAKTYKVMEQKDKYIIFDLVNK